MGNQIYDPIFFEDKSEAVSVMNKLNKKKYINDRSFYEDGDILFFDVFDNPETRLIVSSIISDIDEYIVRNSECFATDEKTQIDLSTMLMDYRHHFGENKEIRYNKGGDRFENWDEMEIQN